MKRIRFFVFLLAMVLLAQPALAIEDENGRYPTLLERGLEGLSGFIKQPVTKLLKEPIENVELDFFAGQSLGYDDNMYLLHHDRIGSFFSETIFMAEAKYPMPVWDWIKLKLGYDYTHMLYFRNSDADLFDNIIKGGIETILFDRYTLDVEYNLDFVRYPKDNQSNYTGNSVEVGVKHDVTDWIYHKFSWEYLYKDYDRRKTFNRLLTLTYGDREDSRHTFDNQIGITIFSKTLLKVSNKWYFNDSNDMFFDYYDYHAYKISGSLIHLITDRLSGRVNLAYQRKVYDGRVVTDKDEAEHDNLYQLGGSLLYDITSALSLGVSYNYRKNISNENDQQYSGSVISSGLYYSF